MYCSNVNVNYFTHPMYFLSLTQIDKKAMKTSGMVARVRNEVEIHCQLKHPAILEVINLKKFMYQKILFLMNVFQNQNFVQLTMYSVPEYPWDLTSVCIHSTFCTS